MFQNGEDGKKSREERYHETFPAADWLFALALLSLRINAVIVDAQILPDQSCSLERVDHRCSGNEIESLLNATIIDNVAPVQVTVISSNGKSFGGDHLRALLTTRTTNMTITGDRGGSPVFDCSTETVDSAKDISVSKYEFVTLFKLTLVDCRLFIAEAKHVNILSVQFMSSATRRGSSENVKVNVSERCPLRPSNLRQLEPTSKAALSLLKSSAVKVLDCTFRNNFLMPLKIIDSHVEMADCVFRDNLVDATVQTDDLPISAGIAISHDQSGKVSSWNSLTVTIKNTIFYNNSAYGLDSTQRNVYSGDFNNGKWASGEAGAALQIILSSFTKPSSSVAGQDDISVINCTFRNNSFLPCRPPLAIRLSGGALYGGAVSVRFNDSQSLSSVIFNNCTWTGNIALRGGGLAISFHGNGGGNVSVMNGRFKCNIATGQPNSALTGKDLYGFGGGVNVEYHGQGSLGCNNVIIESTDFFQNGATEGGGLYAGFYFQHVNRIRSACSRLAMLTSKFYGNTAQVGAAISWWGGEEWRFTQDVDPELTADVVAESLIVRNCDFQHNTAFYRGTFSAANLQLVLDGKNTFSENINSAIFLQSSVCWLGKHSQTTLTDNFGEVGSGLLMQEARIVVGDRSSMNFYNNTALSKGGGLFASLSLSINQQNQSPHGLTCFIVSQNNTAPTEWSFSAVFEGNKAGQGGAVYSPDLSGCLWHLDGGLSSEELLFPWCEFTNNYMVPSFDTVSVYNSLPGTSAMETAYPEQFSWNTKWLPILPKSLTTLDHISNSVSTDVFKVAIFKGAHNKSCDEIEETASHQFRVPIGNGTVWPGLVSYIEGIACDQLNQSVSAALDLTARSGTSSDKTVLPGNCVSNDDSLNHVMSSVADSATPKQAPLRILRDGHVRLDSRTGAVGPVTIVSNGGVSGLVLATALGSSRRIIAEVNITFEDCPFGYIDRLTDNVTQCVCKAINDPYIFSCHPDRQSVSISRDFYVTSPSIVSGTPADEHEQYGLYACPPGYCDCNGLMSDGCLIDISKSRIHSQLRNSQCVPNRTGVLCGKCAEGTVPSSSLNGGCKKKQSTMSSGASLFIVFLVTFFAVAFLLRFEVRFPNSLRGFVFFAMCIPFLFHHSDVYLVNLMTDSSTTYEFTHALLDLSILLAPGENRFHPYEDAIDVLAYRYATPCFILFNMLIVELLLIPRCGVEAALDWCQSGWKFKFLKFTVKRLRTHVLLFFFAAQSILITSFRLMFQCVPIFGESRFFWDGSQRCWSSGKHQWVVAISVIFMLVFAFLPMILAFFFSIGKPSSCEKKLKPLRNALIFHLHHCHWWVSWDFFRRFLILAVYVPTTGAGKYPEWWESHVQGLSVLVIILLVHVSVWPYKKRIYDDHSEEEDNRSKRALSYVDSWIEAGSDLKNALCYRIPLPARFYDRLWNTLEMVVVCELIVIGQLASSSAQGGNPNDDDTRINLLHTLIISTLVIGYFIFIAEIAVAIIRSSILEDFFRGKFPNCMKCLGKESFSIANDNKFGSSEDLDKPSRLKSISFRTRHRDQDEDGQNAIPNPTFEGGDQ